MNEEELRIECLRMANSLGLAADVIVQNAAEFERFVREGRALPQNPKSRDRQLTASEIAAANRPQ